MKNTFRDIKPGDIIYIVEVETGVFSESKISYVHKHNNYFGYSERRVFLENGDHFEAPAMAIANRQNNKNYYVNKKFADDFLKERPKFLKKYGIII